MKKKENKNEFISPEITVRDMEAIQYNAQSAATLVSKYIDQINGIKELIKQFPNDQDLGRELRRYAEERF